ncbi:MAG: N-acetylglucosamine-6-phosphate deacetylase [Verrucomicrobiota bacterium]|nr:N-acetylglucosamine-6-phosphate deacetylase [Verrucomicrobiota bacterium]
MIIRNARLVLPDGIREGLELIESGGKICGIRDASHYPDREAWDFGGNYLAPGFIDLHVHGAMGRDTMEASAEAFREICAHHASGGTTSLLLTTTTAPLEAVFATLESVSLARAALPQISGAHVEGPFISRQRAGAQAQEDIRGPDAPSIAELLRFADVVKRVTLAPELPGAVEAIVRLRAQNIAVSGGHSDAWDEEVRAAFAAGMRHATHTFNCMSSARRRGTERVAGLLEVALSEPEIVCELIADAQHVSPTLMKMLYRAKGAAGICLVTDATAGAGLPSGTRFTLGGKDCIVRDGACWVADGSALAGSSARMIDLVRTMVQQVGVSLGEAVAMASATPARALSSTTKGLLEVGYDADFVSLSPELEVLQTFVAGDCIFTRQR